MKTNFAHKKAWTTPSIEAAPVRMTEGGFIDTFFETNFVFNDDKKDQPSSAS